MKNNTLRALADPRLHKSFGVCMLPGAGSHSEPLPVLGPDVGQVAAACRPTGRAHITSTAGSPVWESRASGPAGSHFPH